MAASLPDIAELLHAWRQRGSDGGALRSHRIETLAARAARLQGTARELLDAKLRLLIQDDLPAQDDADVAIASSSGDASTLEQSLPAMADLSALVLRLSGLQSARCDAGSRDGAAVTSADDGSTIARAVDDTESPMQTQQKAGFPALPALDAMRLTWAQLRTAGHLQHIMAEVPEDAGPLHSTVLVHRAIALMHDTAPGYLQHFLGYMDALAELERISPTPATTPAPRSPRPPRPASPANASGPGKRPRPRSRGRRRPA